MCTLSIEIAKFIEKSFETSFFFNDNVGYFGFKSVHFTHCVHIWSHCVAAVKDYFSYFYGYYLLRRDTTKINVRLVRLQEPRNAVCPEHRSLNYV